VILLLLSPLVFVSAFWIWLPHFFKDPFIAIHPQSFLNIYMLQKYSEQGTGQWIWYRSWEVHL
jgi:hypothetical protein